MNMLLKKFTLCVAITTATGSTLAAEPATPADAGLAAKAESLFGRQPGQSFDAKAFTAAAQAPRTETLTLTLPPGKGTEVKAAVAKGQSFVFQWTASAEVLVDMHGELPDAHDEYTSYSVDDGQREGSGLFVAPFDGNHGWFWQNRGKQPVAVKVTVTGFQTRLFRPGKAAS